MEYIAAREPIDWILRVGDGCHFRNSAAMHIWGIKSKNKTFMNEAIHGDRLWFIESKSRGKIIAVAEFVKFEERVLGPLVALTRTNDDLGWTNHDGDWDTEVHYTGLRKLSDNGLLTEIKGACVIRKYNSNCKVNLPEYYPWITRLCPIVPSI